MANGISNFLNIQNSGKLIKGTASYKNKFEILINSGKLNHFILLTLILLKKIKILRKQEIKRSIQIAKHFTIHSFHPFKWTKLKENKSLLKGILIHPTSSIKKTNLLMKSLVIMLKKKYQNLMTRTEFHLLIVNNLVKFKIKFNRQKENQLCNITSAIKEGLKNLKFLWKILIQKLKKTCIQVNKKAKYLKLKKKQKKISYNCKIQKIQLMKI